MGVRDGNPLGSVARGASLVTGETMRQGGAGVWLGDLMKDSLLSN